MPAVTPSGWRLPFAKASGDKPHSPILGENYQPSPSLCATPPQAGNFALFLIPLHGMGFCSPPLATKKNGRIATTTKKPPGWRFFLKKCVYFFQNAKPRLSLCSSRDFRSSRARRRSARRS